MMLDALITGKTRIKLLLRFFLNPSSSSYLRQIAGEFNESTNAIRIELKRFVEAGLLVEKRRGGGKVFYSANMAHPLFAEIHSIVQKTLGIDKLMEELIEKVGSVRRAFIVGDYAKGVDSGIVDLVLVGRGIDMGLLHGLVVKVERLIGRKIRYLVIDPEEEGEVMKMLGAERALLLWSEDGKLQTAWARYGEAPVRHGSEGLRLSAARGGK